MSNLAVIGQQIKEKGRGHSERAVTVLIYR